MASRVVVTGMGVVSPVGNSVDAFWSALRSGKCGVGPITCFDPEGFASRVAAEVSGFDPCDFMDPKAAKRMARFTQFAVTAALAAWEQAGLARRPPTSAPC